MAELFPVTTARLVLREFTADDAAGVHGYATDETVVRFMPWGPNSEAETRTFIDRVLAWQRDEPRTHYEVAITRRDGGELIGACGLRIIRPDAGEGEVGYVLRRDCWGQGFTPEAVDGLCRVGFGPLELHRICAYTDPQNIASGRVLEKSGFQLEGSLREHIHVKGAWRNSLVFGLLADEWRARSGAPDAAPSPPPA